MESDLPHIVNLINSVIGVGILERVFKNFSRKIEEVLTTMIDSLSNLKTRWRLCLSACPNAV